jgi:SAM-dependent methyltransferase
VLDVATGGGHVARRLRNEGITVVTCDPAPGMRPEVVCRAESLPFADASFDVVTCRTAAHHFEDPATAVAEMARVAALRVLVVDTLHMGDAAERAEQLRDPSHVRNYSLEEWHAFVEDAGLTLEEVRVLPHVIDFAAWLARTGCEGDEAERVRELWGERVTAGRLTLDKIALRAGKGS